MKNSEINKMGSGSMNFRTTGLGIGLILAMFCLNIFAQDVAESLNKKNDINVSNDSKESQTQKEAPSTGENNLITATTYAFSALNGVALEDMSTGTTQLVAASQDDTASAVTNIGFDFWFDGVRFTQFSVNANGLARLGATAVGTTFDNSANGLGSTVNAPKIAPYFEDLCTGTNGNIRFKVVGTAPSRKLVVEWNNMQVTRGAGCAGAGGGTFQMWLFESSAAANPGVIQFVYGNGIVASNVADLGASIGLQSGAATNFASVTGTTDTVSYVGANNVNTAGLPAGKSYIFTPNIPLAPTGLSFTGVTPTAITLNWTDNATNEFGYAVYRSVDNVTFTFAGQAAANATAFADSGLLPSTNYFYRVFAVTEGALSSPALLGSQATAAPANDTCNGAGGLWSAPATWTDGSVPTISDNVTIGAGCTVTIDIASSGLNVTVQNGGILQFEQTTARTLTVAQNVTIDAGGTFRSNAAGTVVTHVLSVGNNLTNNGTLDFSTNADTAGAGITFAAGATNVTFSGTGATTDVRTITVAKGAQATIVDLTVSNFTVRGVNTDVAGYLTITSGTFRIGGTFTMTNRTFPGPTYTIPLLGGLWMNNPNYTVAATASGTATNNNGLFRMTQGVYNIGLTGADGMGGGAGATFIVEGGTINATRFDPQSAVSFTMSNGTFNISPTTGNTRSNFGSFELFSTTSSFNMSGGTINLIQASVGATPIDWQVRSNPFAVTGGVVNVGTAATVTNFNFRFAANAANTVIDNTTNAKTVTAAAQTLFQGNLTINPGTTLALNGFLVAPAFASTLPLTVTNNGTITGNTTGSRLYFLSSGPAVTYTGTGIAGTTALPLLSVDFDAVGGVGLGGATNNLITNRVILFTGSVTGANKIELGVGGTSTGTVQIGNTTTATNAGTFDAPFTFNLGTGGQVNSYLRTTTSYTTGGEINPARTLTAMTVDNNVSSLNIGGGNLTVSGAMTLTNGIVNTSAANTLIHNGAATRTNGFVDGPLRRDYSAPGTYTYFVGEGAFSPVLANVTAVTATSSLTAEAFNATLSGFNPATALSRNWDLNEVGDLTADLSFTYDVDANDVNGNEADYRVWRRESNGAITNLCPGAPCVNTATNTLGPITGVTQFSRWTGAENIAPVAAEASISGRVTAADGIGIRNAVIVVSGGNLTSPRTLRTSAFGYFMIEGLEVGETYVLTVNSKRFTFTNPNRIITLNENVADADFTAEAP